MTRAKIAANLLINELLPRLKRAGLTIEQSPVTPEQMGLAVAFKDAGLITTKDIREALDRSFDILDDGK